MDTIRIAIKNAPITIIIEPMYHNNRRIGYIRYVKLFGIVVLKKAKID